MKTVASRSALQALAVRQGASADVGGRKLNASGAQLSVVPLKKAEAPTPPDPQALMRAAIAESSASSSAVVGEAMKDIGAMLAAALMQLKPPEQPSAPASKQWAFDVLYDEDGRITNIIASEQE